MVASIPETAQRVRGGSGRAPSWMVLALACTGQFMVVLDISVVNVALPSIHRDLGFSTTGLQWVVNAYTLTFAGFLLLGGRAGDLFGRRRIFLLGLGAFSLASLVGGFATSQTMLVAARAAQGLGGAILAPSTLAILTTAFTEPRERARAMGIWAGVAGAGGAVGNLLSGIITQELTWRWVLFINVPIGLVVLVAGFVALPESRGRERRGLDLPGAFLVTGGLCALVYGVVRTDAVGWASRDTALAFGLAVLLLVAFVVHEACIAAAPIMPLRLFRSRSVSSANLAMLAVAAALFPMWYFLSLYCQEVRDLSPIVTGLLFAPLSLSVVAGSQVTVRLVGRLGTRRLVIAGPLLMAAGLFVLSRIGATREPLSVVILAGVVAAFGIGVALTPITLAATSGIRGSEAGLASGLVNTSRQVGASLGLAALATVATSRSDNLLAGAGPHPVGAALSAGFGLAFAVAAGIAVLAALIALALPRRASDAQVIAVEAHDKAALAAELGA
jgi:EmrB/QacA subfamily drug resistance transporter